MRWGGVPHGRCLARGAREKISPHPSLSKRGIRRTWMDVISGAHPGMCPSFLTPHSTKFATDPESPRVCLRGFTGSAMMNRPVRTRMQGGVGAGGETPPATRLGKKVEWPLFISSSYKSRLIWVIVSGQRDRCCGILIERKNDGFYEHFHSRPDEGLGSGTNSGRELP